MTTRLVRTAVRLATAVSLAAAVLVAGPSGDGHDADALSRWTGGIDLYRTGVFTTQQTWLWCTAADVQIMRNIARHQADHARSSQQRYFDVMRAHDRYRIPLKDGVDPGGWTAGLRRYVEDRYRLVASASFDSALRSAVTNLRRTSLPVAITVAHGDHAWVLTGFTATADPATTSRFTITSVRVTGPLWGLQSRSYGYDMRPDTKLTPRQLAAFFTPGIRRRAHGVGRTVVLIQPIPRTTLKPRPTPAPSSLPATTRRPVAVSSATPHPCPRQNRPAARRRRSIRVVARRPTSRSWAAASRQPRHPHRRATPRPVPPTSAAHGRVDRGPGRDRPVPVGAIATARNGSGSRGRRTRRSRLD